MIATDLGSSKGPSGDDEDDHCNQRQNALDDIANQSTNHHTKSGLEGSL
jgi:hypothetical protein